jgi:Flp pilus assembly protein TadB
MDDLIGFVAVILIAACIIYVVLALFSILALIVGIIAVFLLPVFIFGILDALAERKAQDSNPKP